MGHYPGSVDNPERGTVYGPLPTHGFDEVALVLHTTETRGMPGFNHGDTAPHYVYSPTTRVWTMWSEYEDGYVGTMKGHSTGGHSNCKAFQVEILGYSDGNHSPWVGDFTDQNYQDLADFVKWARERYGIGDMVTPTPDGGWRYGTGSEHRLSDEEWAEFTGLTAHGAVPRNTHWDTGVLDLARIDALAKEEGPVDPTCPWDEPCDMHYNKDEWGEDSTGICNAPEWAYEALDWGVDVGMIRVRDTSRDDFNRNLTDGRYWVFQERLLNGVIE